MIKVVIKKPGQPAYIDIIPKGYKAIQEIVDGDIDAFDFDLPVVIDGEVYDCCGFCNDMALIYPYRFNFMINEYTVINGTVVIEKKDEEDESISFTDKEAEYVCWLLDYYAGAFNPNKQ